MKIQILSLSLLLLLSCSKDKKATLIYPAPKCTSKVIINKELYLNSPDDKFNLLAVRISDDCMFLDVSYGGGCGDVLFYLVGVDSNLRLSFFDDDTCKAIIYKTVGYDISSMKIEGQNQIYIKLDGWNASILYQY